MIRLTRAAASVLLGGLACAALASAQAPAPQPAPQPVPQPGVQPVPVQPGQVQPGQPGQPDGRIIPYRKQTALKGKAVGILVNNAHPVLSAEGRYGPPDQLVFSTAGCSYHWIYLPTAGNAEITQLQVPVGENGLKQIYPALNLARLKYVKAFNVEADYTLVEVEVNNGQGSPRNDSFVATQIRVLEGTKDYPLQVAKCVAEMKQKFAAYKKDQAKALEAELEKVAKQALGADEKVTGPRDGHELMYVTWMPDTERLQVRFAVKVTDGSYKVIKMKGPGGGPIGPGGGPIGDPVPLPPVKEIEKKLPPPPQNAPQAATQPAQPAPQPGPGGPVKQPPPPPPRDFEMKTGTSFSVDYGVIYEIDKQGKLVNTEVVPFAASTQRIQVQMGGPGGGPRFELPPPPKQ
jgi:hypothetical protein